MHALVVMHRRTLYENVDSAKIKVPFYTTDIDILRVASMHRIIIHCIDITIHIDESLHRQYIYYGSRFFIICHIHNHLYYTKLYYIIYYIIYYILYYSIIHDISQDFIYSDVLLYIVVGGAAVLFRCFRTRRRR